MSTVDLGRCKGGMKQNSLASINTSLEALASNLIKEDGLARRQAEMTKKSLKVPTSNTLCYQQATPQTIHIISSIHGLYLTLTGTDHGA